MVKGFLFACLAFCVATSLFAQYEVSVTTIPVWVKVQDKSGNPVRGLTSQDFELFEDGKRIETTCFEEVVLEAGPDTAPASGTSQSSESQKFVIFLDLYNTTPREYAAVKPALQQFLQQLSGKNVEVMLTALMPDRRLGIISKFTKDLRRIRILMDFAKANPGRDVNSEAKAKDMKDALDDQMNPNQNANAGDGPKAAVEAIRQEDGAIDGYQAARVFASQDAQSSRYTLRALETFGEYINNMELRNHASVILVSGGISVDPGRRFFNMADRFTEKSGDQNYHDKPQLRQTGFSFQTELQESIGKLNRLNVTVYTLDTRGAATEAEFQDSLIQMAQETGGLAFYNSTDFSSGLKMIQEDLKHQYLLCYTPPQHKESAKYHKIRVNVKRSDVSVRAREGYWE